MVFNLWSHVMPAWTCGWSRDWMNHPDCFSPFWKCIIYLLWGTLKPQAQLSQDRLQSHRSLVQDKVVEQVMFSNRNLAWLLSMIFSLGQILNGFLFRLHHGANCSTVNSVERHLGFFLKKTCLFFFKFELPWKQTCCGSYILVEPYAF